MKDLLNKVMQTHEFVDVNIENYLEKTYPELYKDIVQNTNWMDKDTSFETRVFYWYNDINEYILCEKCKEPIKNLTRFWKYKKNTFVTPNNTCMLCNDCRRQGSQSFNSKNSFNINKDKPSNEDFDKTLVSLYESCLEVAVCNYINSLGYTERYVIENCHEITDYVRNTTIIDTSNNKKLQLDIYFPLLKFAIEVQDFYTHSRVDDEVLIDTMHHNASFIQRFKHGPTYHEHKRKVAADQGITLIDLWEDDIRSENYKKELDKWIKIFI